MIDKKIAPIKSGLKWKRALVSQNKMQPFAELKIFMDYRQIGYM
jgi:hypothetical protein